MSYFAYGSNMLESRLKHPSRAPSALCLGVAVLSGYQLRFHKVAKDGSGKCNALKTDILRDAVYGVVFRVADRDFTTLDEQEDVPGGGYSRKQVTVVMSYGAAEVCAECYFANPEFIDDNLTPYEWYKALVVAGALEHDLPEEYVRQLRDCPAIVDTDPERAARATDLLNP